MDTENASKKQLLEHENLLKRRFIELENFFDHFFGESMNSTLLFLLVTRQKLLLHHTGLSQWVLATGSQEGGPTQNRVQRPRNRALSIRKISLRKASSETVFITISILVAEEFGLWFDGLFQTKKEIRKNALQR